MSVIGAPVSCDRDPVHPQTGPAEGDPGLPPVTPGHLVVGRLEVRRHELERGVEDVPSAVGLLRKSEVPDGELHGKLSFAARPRDLQAPAVGAWRRLAAIRWHVDVDPHCLIALRRPDPSARTMGQRPPGESLAALQVRQVEADRLALGGGNEGVRVPGRAQ